MNSLIFLLAVLNETAFMKKFTESEHLSTHSRTNHDSAPFAVMAKFAFWFDPSSGLHGLVIVLVYIH